MLACGWVVIWVARMMFTPIYPELSAFFGGATSTELGAVSSWYFLGYALMQIPSGLLVDRFGMRRVVIPGFALFAFGTAVMVAARSLPVLYLGNALAGVGSGTFYGIAYTITNTRVPAARKSLATAIVNSGTAVGSGLGIASASRGELARGHGNRNLAGARRSDGRSGPRHGRRVRARASEGPPAKRPRGRCGRWHNGECLPGRGLRALLRHPLPVLPDQHLASRFPAG
jgi:hypothetical protein